MSMWTLVKALLLKDLIGCCIGLVMCGLLVFACWLAVAYERRWDKKHPYAVRKGDKE